MKKYDLILVALYVAFLFIFGLVLNSFVSEDIADRKEMHALKEKLSQTEVKAVVIKNTDLNVSIRRVSDEDRVTLRGGNIPRTSKQDIRLSQDTLYISACTGKAGYFVFMSVPDSVQVVISAAPKVVFEE